MQGDSILGLLVMGCLGKEQKVEEVIELGDLRRNKCGKIER